MDNGAVVEIMNFYHRRIHLLNAELCERKQNKNYT